MLKLISKQFFETLVAELDPDN